MSDIPILGSLNLPVVTYTPVLTALTTNPTLGTGGSTTGRYYRIGKLVIGHFGVFFGTAGAAAGSGEYRVSIPVTIASGWIICGHGWAIDADGPMRAFQLERGTDGNYLSMNQGDAVANQHWFRNNVPWTWTNNDYIRGQFMYEAA